MTRSSDFPPTSLIIPQDDHHGSRVGIAADGNGFFITTPFTFGPKPSDSREFVAMYRFDLEGNLIQAEIEQLGSRASIVGEKNSARLPGNVAASNAPVQEAIDRLLGSLGVVKYQDIVAKPFQIEKFGLCFGLIPDSEDDLDDDEEPIYVTLLPGNDMAFMSPWDRIYDT